MSEGRGAGVGELDFEVFAFVNGLRGGGFGKSSGCFAGDDGECAVIGPGAACRGAEKGPASFSIVSHGDGGDRVSCCLSPVDFLGRLKDAIDLPADGHGPEVAPDDGGEAAGGAFVGGVVDGGSGGGSRRSWRWEWIALITGAPAFGFWSVDIDISFGEGAFVGIATNKNAPSIEVDEGTAVDIEKEPTASPD